MLGKRLLWRVYWSSLLIIILAVVAVALYASSTAKGFYLQKTAADLEVRAQLVGREITSLLTRGDHHYIDERCKQIGSFIHTRITVIAPGGVVLGDSQDDPQLMDNHLSRPEVWVALRGERGVSIRYSDTLRQEMIYVAIPIQKEGKVLGVVRASLPITEIDKVLGNIHKKIFFAGGILILLAALVSLSLARWFTRPIEEMKKGAQRFAEGDFSRKLTIPPSEELGGLAAALNFMARQLDEKIRTVTTQRNELEAILSAMREGVVAVDAEERVLTLNEAAASLLGVDTAAVRGHAIQEAIRSAEIQRFFKGLLAEDEPATGEIFIPTPERRYLLLSGAPLRDGSGKKIGALIVFNDITRLRHLEDLRREFVANVSHELKTPITSIKGFVETILDKGLDDKQAAQRFLEIVAKQADLLNALIDDLLSLSKIEQDEEAGRIELRQEDLDRIIEAAIRDYQVKAQEKGIRIAISQAERISAKANHRLLQQAVGNLLDNAIKYSPRGGEVKVQTALGDKEIAISVIDHGCGISQEHLPRLFERFYRVDKGRSKELGGTGLGLAIVKHIAQAHGGRVAVQSTLGKGSTFTIYLPRS